MSRLRVYDQREPTRPIGTLFDHDMIAHALDEVGVRFERWEAAKPIAPGASQDEVIAAYKDDIERLKSEKGYQAVDVISLAADHPQKDVLRQKFLSEQRDTPLHRQPPMARHPSSRRNCLALTPA